MSVAIFIWESRDSQYIYSYGYEIHDKVTVRVLIAFGNLTYFFCCTLVTLTSFSLSILVFGWGEVLRGYDKFLVVNIKNGNNNGNSVFLKKFFKILKTIECHEKILQYPSLIIICYSLEMIFMIFWFLFIKRDKMFIIGNIVEVFFNAVYSCFMISVYSICSSAIPEKLMEIRKTAKYCITNYGNKSFISRNVIFYLKRIEKEDIVYISACGMFKFTREYLLSVIGVTLTYDLLILSLK